MPPIGWQATTREAWCVASNWRKIMPGWLKVISHINPLSYEVSALRGLLIGSSTKYWADFGLLGGAAVVGICAAAALLGRLSR